MTNNANGQEVGRTELSPRPATNDILCWDRISMLGLETIFLVKTIGFGFTKLNSCLSLRTFRVGKANQSMEFIANET